MSAGSSTFYLQICKFLSGAEGILIPDLRRAKAARCFAASFQSMQNRCKQLYFCDDAFLCISGVLLGLLQRGANITRVWSLNPHQFEAERLHSRLRVFCAAC